MTLLPMPPFLPETATSETQLETIAAGRGQAGLARDRRNSRVGHRTRAETGRWRGKLLPADWRVKRNLAGAVVEGCRAGETSLGPGYPSSRSGMRRWSQSMFHRGLDTKYVDTKY